MIEEGRRRFEALMLPHMDAAYNFARWLVRDKSDADDIVQDAYIRAFRFFESFKGTDAKPWLLAVVRNSYRTFAARKRQRNTVPLPEDGEIESIEGFGGDGSSMREDTDPERQLIEKDHAQVLGQLVRGLPEEFREIVILREFEDMPYKTIAEFSRADWNRDVAPGASPRAFTRAMENPGRGRGRP